MAVLNQDDETTKELRNGAKNINSIESMSFWLSVWKLWCEGKSTSFEIEEHEPDELNRLLEKFYGVKNKYDLLALPPCEFFHVYIINE